MIFGMVIAVFSGFLPFSMTHRAEPAPLNMSSGLIMLTAGVIAHSTGNSNAQAPGTIVANGSSVSSSRKTSVICVNIKKI